MSRLLVICVAIAWVLVAPFAHAQSPKRIGVIHEGGAYESVLQGLVAGLKDAGTVEGKDFVLHVRDTKGDVRQVDAAAKQLIRERVDFLFTVSTSVTIAAKRATRDIPIVFYAGSDPVRFGLVKSFSRPGDRLTGVHQPSFELTPKRIDLLRQILPKAKHLLAFYDRNSKLAEQSVAEALGTAAKFGLQLDARPVIAVDEILNGMRALKVGEVDAYFGVTDAMAFSVTPEIIRLARERKLPVVGNDLNNLQIGVLLAYGVNYFDVGRFAAKHVQQVMRGVKPQDLPVEIYDGVQLGLNLRVAKELGVTVPQPLILRADQVIR